MQGGVCNRRDEGGGEIALLCEPRSNGEPLQRSEQRNAVLQENRLPLTALENELKTQTC